MRIIKHSEAEIDELMNMAADAINNGRSRWPGMSYEQGIEDGLQWLFGEINEHPLKDE
jgi:hypothetical protein